MASMLLLFHRHSFDLFDKNIENNDNNKRKRQRTLTSDFHSKTEGFNVTLAVFSCFFDEEFAVVDNHANKAFVAENITTLSVGVRQSAVSKFAQTPVFAL